MTPSSAGNPSPHAEAAVLAALESPRYDFRTVEGIAEETGLSEECVRVALESLLADRVRVSLVQDKKGRDLYTLRSHSRTATEIISEARAFLAGSAR